MRLGINILPLQYFHNDVAMEYLLNVLEQLNERTSTSVSLLDAQIKLIRVVANMSVNPEVGAALGNVRSLGAVLLEILKKTSGALERKKVGDYFLIKIYRVSCKIFLFSDPGAAGAAARHVGSPSQSVLLPGQAAGGPASGRGIAPEPDR